MKRLDNIKPVIELDGTALNISTQDVNVDPIFTFWHLFDR